MTPTTSRIGRKPVVIPAGVELKINNGESLSAKGPKGSLAVPLHPYVDVALENSELTVKVKTGLSGMTGPKKKLQASIAGTTRANIHNVVHGVSKGFERKLLLVGVGYRAQAKGDVLSLSLGFSHPMEFAVPAGVTVETPVQTEIVVKGPDNKLVGLVAAKIRAIRPPEPYKGKGVRYADEVIEIKETKKK